MQKQNQLSIKLFGPIVSIVLAAVAGAIYPYLLNFASGWGLYCVVNLAVLGPVALVLAIYCCAWLSAKAYGRFGATIIAALTAVTILYVSWIGYVHQYLDVWVFTPAEIMEAAGIVADLRVIHVLFIPFTGMGLIICYWLELILVALVGIGVVVSPKKPSERSKDKGEESNIAREALEAEDVSKAGNCDTADRGDGGKVFTCYEKDYETKIQGAAVGSKESVFKWMVAKFGELSTCDMKSAAVFFAETECEEYETASGRRIVLGEVKTSEGNH